MKLFTATTVTGLFALASAQSTSPNASISLLEVCCRCKCEVDIGNDGISRTLLVDSTIDGSFGEQ